MKALVLDGESNAAWAVLQSIGRAAVQCWLAGRADGSAFRSRYAKTKLRYPDPLENKQSFKDWLLALQVSERFDLILPCTDITIHPVHEVRRELGKAAVLPPISAMDVAFDKEKLYQLASSLEVPVPQSRWIPRSETFDESLARSDFFPVVIKPVRSKVWEGTKGYELHVAVSRSETELLSALRGLLPLTSVQLQEWVPGHGLGIEILASEGKIEHLFAHERLHEYPLTGGGSSYRRSTQAASEIVDCAHRLIGALSWSGVAMLEFRMDVSTNRFWLMEMNGRFWGSLPLAIFAGVDFPCLLASSYSQAPLPLGAPKDHTVYARNFGRDIQWIKSSLSARGTHRTDLIRPPLLLSLLQWSRVLSGRETWDGASWRDPLPILHHVAMTCGREIRGLGVRFKRAFREKRELRRARARASMLSRSKNVLVVCDGNICRSPYAADRLRHNLSASGVEVRSAGFRVAGPRKPPRLWTLCARHRGIDLGNHKSSPVTTDLVEWADVILLMGTVNARRLRHFGARARAKSLWLGAFDSHQQGIEILDPIHLTGADLTAVFDKLDRCVEALTQCFARESEVVNDQA